MGTLWSNSKWTHQITQQVFCEWTHQVLSQFCSKCTHNVPEPLIESFFKEYLAIWSQCTQPYTWWVLWEFVVKLNHIESLLWVLWKELTGYIMGVFLSILWKSSSHPWSLAQVVQQSSLLITLPYLVSNLLELFELLRSLQPIFSTLSLSWNFWRLYLLCITGLDPPSTACLSSYSQPL